VAELVVVQSAGKLSLLQVGSNVLVWHLLQASLEKIYFLKYGISISVSGLLSRPSTRVRPGNMRGTNLILAPCSPSSGRSSLTVFRDTVIVAIHGIRRRGIDGGRGRHECGRHVDPFFRNWSQLSSVIVWSSCRTRRYVPRIEGCSQKELAELAAFKNRIVSSRLESARTAGCSENLLSPSTVQGSVSRMSVEGKRAADQGVDPENEDEGRTSRCVNGIKGVVIKSIIIQIIPSKKDIKGFLSRKIKRT